MSYDFDKWREDSEFYCQQKEKKMDAKEEAAWDKMVEVEQAAEDVEDD